MITVCSLNCQDRLSAQFFRALKIGRKNGYLENLLPSLFVGISESGLYYFVAAFYYLISRILANGKSYDFREFWGAQFTIIFGAFGLGL